MELSQKLKELRKKQGLTQLELAERLFVSRQAIFGACKEVRCRERVCKENDSGL